MREDATLSTDRSAVASFTPRPLISIKLRYLSELNLLATCPAHLISTKLRYLSEPNLLLPQPIHLSFLEKVFTTTLALAIVAT